MVLSVSDELFIIGDSLTVGFNGSVPIQHVYGPLIRAAYGQVSMPSLASPFVPAAKRPWPLIRNIDAATGRSTTNIAVDDATMDAFLLPYRPATAVFVILGINDADQIRNATLTGPTFQTQAQRVVDRINVKWGVPYAKMYWVGPWGHDSGDDLVQILDVETRLATLAALRGFQLCKTSQTWNSGLSVGDGTHPTQAGAVAMAAPIVGGLSFAV